jgi:predicted transcriptional regulator
MQLLQTIKQGKPAPQNSQDTRQILKTLLKKGYIDRQPTIKNYTLTEKGAKTLREHQEIVEKLEKEAIL